MRTIGWGLSVTLLLLFIVGSGGAKAPASSAGIFVADAGNNRIVRIDDMAGSGWSTLGGPAPGGGTNQFSNPRGVAVDTAGRIYVSDAGNNRIVRIDDMTGAGWTTLGGPAAGRGTNQFSDLRSIFVDAARRIYTAEYESGRHCADE
jgi:streptogramin lyase